MVETVQQNNKRLPEKSTLDLEESTGNIFKQSNKETHQSTPQKSNASSSLQKKKQRSIESNSGKKKLENLELEEGEIKENRNKQERKKENAQISRKDERDLRELINEERKKEVLNQKKIRRRDCRINFQQLQVITLDSKNQKKYSIKLVKSS